MKFARVVAILFLKKRKVEANLTFNSAQLEINNDKLSIADISNTKDKSKTWFWNKGANKADSDSKKEEKEDKRKKKDKNNELNPKRKEPRTKGVIGLEIKIK